VGKGWVTRNYASKGMDKNVKFCFTIYNPRQTISFVRGFLLEAMTIIQIFLVCLGKLTFDHLNGWILDF